MIFPHREASPSRQDYEDKGSVLPLRCYLEDAVLHDPVEVGCVSEAEPPRNVVAFRDVQRRLVMEEWLQALLKSAPWPMLMVVRRIRKELLLVEQNCANR